MQDGCSRFCIPLLPSRVFSELQGPMQDEYGIRTGRVQQPRCFHPATHEFVTAESTTDAEENRPSPPPSQNNTARWAQCSRCTTVLSVPADRSIKFSKSNLTSRWPLGVGWSWCVNLD